MNAPTPSVSLQILSSVMHHIDSTAKTIRPVTISASALHLHAYLRGLLAEIRGQENKRVFSIPSPTTELSTCLQSFSVNSDLSANTHSYSLAKRLVREEFESIHRYPNLNPVAKGSFLQFTYADGTDVMYLGVKIEHASYIDVNTLIRSSGLAEDRKLYKAVMVNLSQLPQNDVHVFDTNGNPAAYWWKNFLELDVQRNDSENTKLAIEAVIKVLGPLKKDFPSDHSLLRNAAIAAFKQQTTLVYSKFVDDLIKNYSPIDANAKPKLALIETKLRDLPTTKKFDTQFSLDPSMVPYRQRKLVLSPEITLTIKEGIDRLEEKIWASKTKDGNNVLVIQTENISGFQFKS